MTDACGRDDLAGRIRDLLGAGALDLAPIGAGHTAERWHALAALARRDVSEARIAEAHVDAMQILAEAGRPTPGARLWGVWASESPRQRVTAERLSGGRISLHGHKGFCGGAGIVDQALVTVELDRTPQLIAVALDDLDPSGIDRTAWATSALADTATATVDLTGLVVDDDALVGAAGWYTERAGFWHGAIGPAACWAGAAQGLADHAVAHPPSDPHGRAHLGALVARSYALDAVLRQAGDEIDAASSTVPTDVADDDGSAPGSARAAHRRALMVRHLVDVGCAEIQDRFARALGPRPLVSDVEVIARNEALSLYRRQCHAERDLAALGDLVDGGPS